MSKLLPKFRKMKNGGVRKKKILEINQFMTIHYSKKYVGLIPANEAVLLLHVKSQNCWR